MSRKRPKIEGGYIIIPKLTIKCQQYHQLTNVTKLVYQAFLVEFKRDTKLNPRNEVKVTHGQLEVYSSVSHSSVVRAVRQLKKKGFIKVLKQGGLELNWIYTNTHESMFAMAIVSVHHGHYDLVKLLP